MGRKKWWLTAVRLYNGYWKKTLIRLSIRSPPLFVTFFALYKCIRFPQCEKRSIYKIDDFPSPSFVNVTTRCFIYISDVSGIREQTGFIVTVGNWQLDLPIPRSSGITKWRETLILHTSSLSRFIHSSTCNIYLYFTIVNWGCISRIGETRD